HVRGSLPRRDKDARADNRADAERRKRNRPQHATQPVLAVHLGQECFERFACEQALTDHVRSFAGTFIAPSVLGTAGPPFNMPAGEMPCSAISPRSSLPSVL